MTDIEKKVKMRELKLILDKYLQFFRIINYKR